MLEYNFTRAFYIIVYLSVYYVYKYLCVIEV